MTSAVLSSAHAVLAASVIAQHPSRKDRNILLSLIILPLVLPEIVVAIAILGFFSMVGMSAGKLKPIIAHTVVCIPFAFLPVRARL